MLSDISGCEKQIGRVERLVAAHVVADGGDQEVRSPPFQALDDCWQSVWPDWTGVPDAQTLKDFHSRVDSDSSRHWMPSPAVDGLLRGASLVLTHHNIPQVLLADFQEQARSYLTCDDEMTFVARAKFLLCAPMARYLRNEAPPFPDVVYVWKGKVRRWMRSRMSFCAKNTHLWWSFYQAKRACAPVSEGYVKYTYEKHRRQMAASDPIDEETFSLIMDQLEPVLERLSQDLGTQISDEIEIEGGDSVPLPSSDAAHAASTSACYESTVKDGGQRGYLAKAFADGQIISPEYVLSSMKWFPRVVIDGVLRFNTVVSFYESSRVDSFLRKVGSLEVELWNRLNGDQDECVRLPCMIQGIIEPLKVRVISKGPAAPYYLAKSFQKALHTAMRGMDCFRLIGRPMSPTDLLDLDANSVRLRMFEGRSWFSIDYSAATDGLSARLSAAILRRLLPLGMGTAEKARLLSVLAPHRCEYPPKSGVAPVDEQNGQLMGSILSFPILCLANLGLFLAVIRNDSRSLKDKLSGVLVNGDDMLYVAPPSLYSEHAALGKKCGLELSVGKSYVHPVFASANSTCFHAPLSQTPRFNGPERVRGVRQINFLNTGLFFGNSKVMRVDSVDGTDASISTRLDVLGALLSGCWSSNQELDLAKMYFALHKAEIHVEAQGRNYFIHRSLGGCGAALPTGWKWTTTARHRAIAFERASRLSGGYSGVPTGRIAGVEFKVFGPREAPGVPDLFSHGRLPWEEVGETPPYEPPRWPTVLCRPDGRATQYVPSNRCFTRTQLVAGVERSQTVRCL